ncbi:uncharacterized protein LOC134234563 [Saccostrea cucullata]|uniref:uncharacterized protein LOC134234563 n=1 Tax=Saccostrea cuccullata TaxID=36930 RepID=UPI002ED57000
MYLFSIFKDCPLVAAIQVGEDNSMEINCGSSFRGPVTFDIKGKNNKVILCHLLDERKVFECTSSGYLKVVLRSDDPAFQDLAESASNLKIEEINKDPVIKDNNITIIEIKPGNLVMMFFIENNYTLEKNIEWIFQCIFGRHEITQILENQGVDEVRVHGYIYNLKEYCLEFSRQVRALQTEEADKLYKAAKFHSHSHLTWRFGESTCDVDVLLTDLFHNLSIYGLTTEVNENIWVMAKGNIIHPKETAFSSFASMLTETVDEKEREINVQLAKLGHYEMQGIQDAGNSIHFILKTKTGVKYTELVAEDGVILTVMKRLLLFTYLKSEVNLMRIGIVIDTKLMQNQQNQKETCEGKMEVAIDIGNIFSGYAFATHDQLKQEPVEIQFSTWDGLSREFISYKTPSNILLDEDRNFVAFGFDAEKRYCDLAEDGQHLNFYYFCRFKMLFNDIAKEKVF